MTTKVNRVNTEETKKIGNGREIRKRKETLEGRERKMKGKENIGLRIISRKLKGMEDKRERTIIKNLPTLREHSYPVLRTLLACLNTPEARVSIVALRARSYILRIHISLFLVI